MKRKTVETIVLSVGFLIGAAFCAGAQEQWRGTSPILKYTAIGKLIHPVKVELAVEPGAAAMFELRNSEVKEGSIMVFQSTGTYSVSARVFESAKEVASCHVQDPSLRGLPGSDVLAVVREEVVTSTGSTHGWGVTLSTTPVTTDSYSCELSLAPKRN